MARRYIGVDVGGTKVACAVLEDGRLGEADTEPTELGSTDALLDQLAGVVERQGGADAVGVGVPSTVDWETGRARSSVRIPLEDVPLREVLSERLGVPVFVDNDATVAALAEAHDDDLRVVAQSLVLLTVGTGVGGGIVIGGRIFRGATGAAAELGHQIVAAALRDGAPEALDHPPHPDSLEAWASGSALDRLGRDAGFGEGPAVVEAARAGDVRARLILRTLGGRLALGVANAINTFDPEQVVLGGGVSAAGELLLAPVREAAVRYVLPGVGTATEIRLARYGPQAGVRGAALLALQENEDHP